MDLNGITLDHKDTIPTILVLIGTLKSFLDRTYFDVDNFHFLLISDFQTPYSQFLEFPNFQPAGGRSVGRAVGRSVGRLAGLAGGQAVGLSGGHVHALVIDSWPC